MLFLLPVILCKEMQAQGCSDAGFCTVGSFKHEMMMDTGTAHGKTSRHRISFSAPLGVGDESVFVFTPGIQYDFFASKRWSFQSKITANYASGNLGNAFGPGDIYLSSSYVFPHKKEWYVQALLGVKIPLHKSNLDENGKPLPMQYQSSLGTIDLIAGATFSNDDWQLSAAIQQPLSGINQNHFLPAYWNKPEAENYPPTNDLNRKGDVLFRVGKNFRLGESLFINAGILNIVHLGKDEYIDANISNEPIAIDGSEGLTVNITAAIWWQLNTKLRIGCTAGAPLAVREVRPDGLTRKFVVAPEISWSF
jgi:hypothetical protein